MSTAVSLALVEAQPQPTPRPVWVRRSAITLGALWLLSGIYLVQADQQAVVVRFGAVVEPRVPPGLHYSLPWPVDRVFKLKVQQQRRLVIGGDLSDAVLGRTRPLTSQFLTGDQNIINMRVAVQYSVGTPADFLFRTQDPSQVLGGAVESELARRLAHIKVDDILTTEKIAIQNAVRSAAQAAADTYRIGVAVSSVNIEAVKPPDEAADAFRDVASARADAIRIVNESQGYANDLVPRARGEANQLLESARAYKESKINRATGDADRFTQVAAEYQKAPVVTSQRAYIEALEQVLPKIRKLIVDPNGNLDLTIIRKGDGAAPKK
jgi:membrane protease subunit HflK